MLLFLGVVADDLNDSSGSGFDQHAHYRPTGGGGQAKSEKNGERGAGAEKQMAGEKWAGEANFSRSNRNQ
jgi:hypothetical protein